MLAITPPALPPPVIEGTVVCVDCPAAPIHVLAYPATDRYNWPWWDVYGFLHLLHEPGALDGMRPEPVASLTLDRPGRFRLELAEDRPAHLFALLDVDRDGAGRGPSAVDWVGRSPRNPIDRAAPADEHVVILYPQGWRRDFEALRWHPDGSGTPPSLRFVDATAASGIDFRHCQGGDLGHLPVVVGSGALLDDLDGDGDLDLIAVQGLGDCPGAPATSRLYAGDGAGHFRDVTAGSGLEGRATGMGVIAGDVDADGDLDLLLTALQGARLLRNEGGMRFRDVTAAAGVADPGAWPVGASFGDVDGDADLDLYVANYVTFSVAPPFTADAEIPSFSAPMLSSPFAFPAQPNALYLNRGDGTFTAAADALGATDPAGKGMAATLANLDADGDLDLFVTNDCSKDRLFENRAGRFVDVSGAAAVDDVSSGMGIALGDVDGDGRANLFSPHWRNEPAVLYAARAETGLSFVERTVSAGLAAAGNGTTGWASELFDADLDGDLDLLVTTGHTHPGADPGRLEPQPLQLFVGDGRGGFSDASCALWEAVPEPGVWRGAALGDVDGDGDVDAYVVAWNGRGRLLRNDSIGGGWLGLRLVRASGEVGAIGAVVEVRDGDGRRQVRHVTSGTGYLSHSSLEIEIGLGEAATAAEALVTWPGGRREAFTLQGDARRHTLVEGTGR